MPRLLIRNADAIVSCDSQDHVYENCSLLIENGVIAGIGPEPQEAEEVIDASGCIVYPGLGNTHHHLYQTFSRNLPAVQNLELFDWLKALYEIWKNLDREVIYHSALPGLGELLKSGCTTCFDHHYVFPQGRSEGLLEAQFAAAEELGIRASVKVAAGAGDNAAAAVGTGTVGDNMCNISLGTSGTIFISSKHFGVDRYNALHSFAHADGSYHLMGCMLSAASCNKWWMDDILGTKDYAGEQQAIGKLGENHVYFLPYLMGERSPHNNPNARAVFLGMSMDTTRADMTQAVLEGVAFALRDSLEVARSLGISLTRTKICGGGAKSPLWKKIIANVLNLKVDVLESEEGPSMGGAMLAAVACGEYASVEEIAAKVVKVVETVEPDAELAAKYEERYREFKEIYPACKPLF